MSIEETNDKGPSMTPKTVTMNTACSHPSGVYPDGWVTGVATPPMDFLASDIALL